MFKICNGYVPDYLSELFPQKHLDRSQYNTRNKHQIIFQEADYSYTYLKNLL
jgi:hypothetical protein